MNPCVVDVNWLKRAHLVVICWHYNLNNRLTTNSMLCVGTNFKISFRKAKTIPFMFLTNRL